MRAEDLEHGGRHFQSMAGTYGIFRACARVSDMHASFSAHGSRHFQSMAGTYEIFRP